MPAAILLIDHGSRRDEANRLVIDVADTLAAGGLRVAYAHLELATPTVPDTIDALVAEGFDRLVVHPFFLAPGRHAAVDVPRLCEEARERHPSIVVVISEPLGRADDLAELVGRRIATLLPP